ncbi:serine hydrolase domain-containing protein [Phenylobacterium sp.]|uniref:serine hydrolase domain-containing protein n=1 Tax=Phenylobacterium sp. TaxID=1871053 RepID=UPI003562BF0C
MDIVIEGFAAPGLESVRETFAANFARKGDYQELGAAFCVYRDGEPIVDLWGGFADAARTRPWSADTLVNVWSTTKLAAAVAVARLVDRGLIAYDQPVADVWPEFAAAGKAGVTIAEAMSHQAGLPGFTEPTTLDDLYDWDLICDRLAAQAPVFPPGTASSYHAVTYGFLAGEIVRRASGQSLGALFRDEIAGPLGADFHISLPAWQEPRVAELLGPKSPVDTSAMDLPAPARMALGNPEQDPVRPNDRRWRAAELPALNGQASARGVARLAAALARGGELDGARILSEATVAAMSAIVADRPDLMLGFNPQWGMGVAHNLIGVFGTNPRTIGHSGWGGSFGCADPDGRIAIGYVLNQMGSELVGDPRGKGLADAVYAALA